MKLKKELPLALVMAGLLWQMALPVGAQENQQGLTLKECLAAALSRNPLVQEALLGIQSAEEAVISVGGKHWPRLSLDGAYFRREQPFPYIQAQAINIPPHFSDAYSALGLTLTIPIYQGGQVTTGVSLAEVRREIQVLTAGQTKNDLLANTVNAYNKILQLQQIRKASQSSVNALQEQVKNTRLLLDVGRLARVDLLKVEVQLANERQRLLATEEALKNAAATLRYLMGEGPQAENPVPALKEHLAAHEFQADFSTGLTLAQRRRPEYLAARKAVEEAELNRKLVFGRLLPTINIFGSDTRWTGDKPYYSDTIWMVGVNLTLPLFDRSLYADLSRERFQEERAAQRLRAVENQVGLDVSTAIASLVESRNRVSASVKAVNQGEESFRIEQQRYESGAGAMVDLLLAQAASITALANYTQALFDYNAAVVAYRRATGTLEDYLQ
jgi:outer membrane protein